MKVGYLGVGVWGYTLAHLLASKGYTVTAWGIDKEVVEHLKRTREHPKLVGHHAPDTLQFTMNLEETLQDVDLLVEGVTSAGMRPVFESLKKLSIPNCPIVLTSKGIEQDTGLLLSEVVTEILGEEHKNQVGCLSGPTIAQEVLRGVPTSVVASGYSQETIATIHEAFTSPTFRVYPNSDINGVELGGALKNVIAIACGVSDGMGFGDNAKAALMTRGLHEIRKLAKTMGCKPETLNGLAGMGDLCVTCLSKFSRNYRFGNLIAEGLTPDKAKEQIGMVVEGSYSCLSARQLGQKNNIELPITEAVYQIVYENLAPINALKMLMQRTTKEEML